MKLARTVAGAVLAAAAVGGATTSLLLLGTAGATSGRRAEVDAPPTCRRPLAALADTLGLPASHIRLRLRAGETLAQMAAAQGVDRQAVVDALAAVGEARIDRNLQTGRLTEEQAARRKAMLPARVAAAVDNPITPDGAEGGGWPWQRRHRAAAGTGRAELAAALGMSPSELRQARAAGQSIADIAEQHGVDRQQVIDALVARSTERITALVNADGVPSECGQDGQDGQDGQ